MWYERQFRSLEFGFGSHFISFWRLNELNSSLGHFYSYTFSTLNRLNQFNYIRHVLYTTSVDVVSSFQVHNTIYRSSAYPLFQYLFMDKCWNSGSMRFEHKEKSYTDWHLPLKHSPERKQRSCGSCSNLNKDVCKIVLPFIVWRSN